VHTFDKLLVGAKLSAHPRRTAVAYGLLVLLIAIGATNAQELKTRPPAVIPPVREPGTDPIVMVPSGTKIPLNLRQPVSTKSASPGDPIYAQTTFPVIVDGSIVIPAGTWVQGVVDFVKRAGRVKGTAELQFHLTKLIYANGYMLDLSAAVDQVPGDTGTGMKEPGTIKHDTEKGKDIERIGQGAGTGGAIGAIAGTAAKPNARGFGVGGLSGIAAGTLIALLTRGSDVTFDTGTAVEIALTHPIAVDRQKAAPTLVTPAP
jgi:type IV secretion system protein VirB10